MSPVLVAILAAGESRRMGAPKLCLPWNGTTVLDHILNQWRKAGADNLLVVHAPTETPVTRELDRLGIVSSQRTVTIAMERGMMGSVITAAVRALEIPSLTHLIIALGDQPHLRVETLRAVLQACSNHPGEIVRILFESHPGHPIALPVSLLEQLSTTSCATLRDFIGLQKCPVSDLTCHDSGVLWDIDTPDDYAEALRRTT